MFKIELMIIVAHQDRLRIRLSKMIYSQQFFSSRKNAHKEIKKIEMFKIEVNYWYYYYKIKTLLKIK